MTNPSRNAIAYAALLAVQTAAATYLFWMVFPIFYSMVSDFGQRLQLDVIDQIRIVGGAAVLHLAYWTRLARVRIVAPLRSRFAAHLLSFASRVSFFFGGAFFSAIFFRHIPELESFPPLGQSMIKVFFVAVLLFGLFCYSLELERLGRAVDEDRPY